MTRMHVIRPSAIQASVPSGHWDVDARDLVSAQTGVRLQHCEMQTGGGAESHVHTNENQIFFVIEGALVIDDADGRTIGVAAGEGVFIPAETSHGTRNDADGMTTYLVVTYPAAASP